MKARDLLATIDAPSLDAQFGAATANLAVAKANYELALTTAARWQALSGTPAVSKQEVDVQVAGAAARKAELAAAEQNLARYAALESFKRVVVPFDGVVTARLTDVGDYVNAGGGDAGARATSTELFTVADIHEMRVFVAVPEGYASALVPGLTATLHLPADPGRQIPAKFLTTARAFSPTTRTAVTELTVDNPDGKLWPGTYVEVQFEVPSDPTILTLPEQALIFQAAGPQVAVVDAKDRVHLRNVTLGQNFGTDDPGHERDQSWRAPREQSSVGAPRRAADQARDSGPQVCCVGVGAAASVARRHVRLPPHEHAMTSWAARLAAPIGAALFGAGVLSGCDLAPRYDPPHLLPPDTYQGSGPFRPASPEAAAVLRGPWWTLFGDSELDRLEEELGRANWTLKAAAETYTQARDLAAEAQSHLYPQLGLEGQLSDNKQSRNRLFRSGTTGPNVESSNILAATASWEPDFWDALRNTAHEQKRLAQSSAGDLANARLSLQAELANDYIALRGLDAELEVLRQSIIAYQQAVEVTRLRSMGQIASGLDLARALSQLRSAEAQQTDTQLERDLMQHAIAVLAGEMPSTFSIPPTRELKLRVPEIPAGLPSELLQRRPDIASAERQMAAANASIGISRAAFYPHVTFSGSGGFQDNGFNLLSLPNSLWSVGAGAVLPLFEGGLRRAELQRSWSQYAQTRDNYRATVLAAFQEVEDGLSETQRLALEARQQQQASEQSAQALSISTTLYQGGLDNYLSVAVAQTQALAAQTIEVQVRTRQVQAAVALIRALGGGWDTGALPSEQETLLFGPSIMARRRANKLI